MRRPTPMPTEIAERVERRATGRTPNYAVTEHREIEAGDFRETDAAFIAYRKSVVKVLTMAAQPVSIPEIHRRLGGASCREWTADALDSAVFVLRIPKYPCDLYAYEPNVRVVEQITVQGGNALPFLKNKRQANMTAARRRFNEAKVMVDGSVTV
jgi:hypothetical protein